MSDIRTNCISTCTPDGHGIGCPNAPKWPAAGRYSGIEYADAEIRDLRAALAAAEERVKAMQSNHFAGLTREEELRNKLVAAERERDEAVERAKVAEERWFDMENSLKHALTQHPDEQHCSCATILAARVRELEVALRRIQFVASTSGKWEEVIDLSARALRGGAGKDEEILLFSLGPLSGPVAVYRKGDGYVVRGVGVETTHVASWDAAVAIGSPVIPEAKRHGPSGVSEAIPLADAYPDCPGHRIGESYAHPGGCRPAGARGRNPADEEGVWCVTCGGSRIDVTLPCTCKPAGAGKEE